MATCLLTLNIGSSSLKYGLYHWPGLACIDTQNRDFDSHSEQAIGSVLQQLFAEFKAASLNIVVVGHRVVHGGTEFTQPVIIDDSVLSRLEALVVLAPLHLPAELAAVRYLHTEYPSLAQVACFDTAFHTNQPTLARLYALPKALALEGILRYGFHGLSYQFISRSISEQLPPRHRQRVIVAHLGSGASLCAMLDGNSIASTMGFSALEGLMMGTRCGDLDAGVVLHLLQQRNMSVDDVQKLLYKQSGLLGVSGISSDVRTLERSDTKDAKQALDLFAYRAALHTGSLMMALGGLDALVFTAGIGEHSADMRSRITAYLSWLNVSIDEEANSHNQLAIHSPSSVIGVYVMATNEEQMIAEQVAEIISQPN